MKAARMLAATVVAVVGVITILGSGTTQVIPQPTGGSRGDGIVELSFEHGILDKPVVDESQTLLAAKHRCAAWGYPGAEAFGGHKRQCQDPPDCYRWFVTMSYQCTGAPEPKL